MKLVIFMLIPSDKQNKKRKFKHWKHKMGFFHRTLCYESKKEKHCNWKRKNLLEIRLTNPLDRSFSDFLSPKGFVKTVMIYWCFIRYKQVFFLSKTFVMFWPLRLFDFTFLNEWKNELVREKWNRTVWSTRFSFNVELLGCSFWKHGKYAFIL